MADVAPCDEALYYERNKQLKLSDDFGKSLMNQDKYIIFAF